MQLFGDKELVLETQLLQYQQGSAGCPPVRMKSEFAYATMTLPMSHCPSGVGAAHLTPLHQAIGQLHLSPLALLLSVRLELAENELQISEEGYVRLSK